MLGFAGRTIYNHRHCSERSDRPYLKESAYLCSDKTLFTKTGSGDFCSKKRERRAHIFTYFMLLLL